VSVLGLRERALEDIDVRAQLLHLAFSTCERLVERGPVGQHVVEQPLS
jgi:hypothetical protein